MPETGDNFKLDQAAAQEAFDRLNAELFGGQLERIPIRLSNAVRKGGSYTAKMFYEQPNAFMRRMLRDYRIKDLHNQAMTLSRKVILTQEALDRVVAHELIHQWQSAVLGISEDNGGHGETFLSKMGEINAVKGAGFVTVTSDVVAGGTSGKAGQTYYVAIFEKAGRRFGGFSRRPFTENILAILEKTSERRGIPYRTVVTTSHDAQNLADMSRMRLNSRSRSWPVIPEDIYDAIISGEVVTAALRRAAMRVADLRGVTLYHGTSLEAAVKIAREGIRSFSGDQWSGNPNVVNAGTDAIYLTPDFELAFRYAQGLAASQAPAILETRISGRHMKRLKTDPMDTWEGAWDESGFNDQLPQHQDDLYRLQNDIHSFLSDRGVRMPFFEAFPGDGEYDEYDGLNIYRLALKYIRQATPEKVKEVFRSFRKAFPPGDHGFYHIRPDGTVRLDSSYWAEAHQLQYGPRGGGTAKPSRLPPAAIKAVWVPAEMAPDGAESQQVRSKRLPGESKEEFDDEARASESVSEWCDALTAAENPEEIGFIRIDDRYLDDIEDDDPEPLLDVREVARSMIKSPGEDHSRQIHELRERYGGFYDPYERWGDETYGESAEMAKVPLDALAKLAPSVAASLRMAAMEAVASSGTVIAYHATLSGSDILEGGFKKSDEVERVGLGGSSMGGSVSFTTDWGVAKGIHKSFVMMHSLVNADDQLAAIKAHLESLDAGVSGKVLEYWKSADGGDLQELLGGWKPKQYGVRMQTYDQLVQQGFRPVHAAGDEGGEGDTLYYQWLEPVSAEDAERMVYTYVKVYFYANDEEYNPVFMGGDASHFKGIPRDDIGVLTVELHIDPSKKQKSHGDLDRAPGYAILPAESEYRISDMSMVGDVLDYDTQPGDEPKVRADEVSFHSDTGTEEAVNRLLSLLQRHRGIIERGGEVDVRRAMALLRNADDMWDVRGMAAKLLTATKLKYARRALEQAIDLRQRSQPSDSGSNAIAALPPTVRSEVEAAAHSSRFSDISERWYDRDEPAYIAWVDRLGDMDMSESVAESEIDDWISSKQWDYEERYAEEMKWVKRDVPGFREEDADEFLELARGLEEVARQGGNIAASLRDARIRVGAANG